MEPAQSVEETKLGETPVKKIISNNMRQVILPSALKMKRECIFCLLQVKDTEVRVTYPCVHQHVVHLQCLYSKENILSCLNDCPACEDSTVHNCTIQEKHTCLLESYEDIKRTLNIGRDQEQILQDIKIDMIQTLAKEKYKHKANDYSSMHVSIDRPTGYLSLSSLFSWGFKAKKPDNQDIGYTGRVINIVNSKEKSSAMFLKNITWRDIIAESIDVEYLFEKGYCVLDFFVLRASWDDLLTSGLRYQMFVEFKEQLDISSLIKYYVLDFYIIYRELCFGEIDNMSVIGLTYQDFLAMKFEIRKLKKRGISEHQIANSKLWNCLTQDQWINLGISPDKYKRRQEIK